MYATLTPKVTSPPIFREDVPGIIVFGLAVVNILVIRCTYDAGILVFLSNPPKR